MPYIQDRTSTTSSTLRKKCMDFSDRKRFLWRTTVLWIFKKTKYDEGYFSLVSLEPTELTAQSLLMMAAR